MLLSPPLLNSAADGRAHRAIVQRKRKVPGASTPIGSPASAISTVSPLQSQSQSSVASAPFISRAERLQRVVPLQLDADKTIPSSCPNPAGPSASTGSLDAILTFMQHAYAEQTNRMLAESVGYQEHLARLLGFK